MTWNENFSSQDDAQEILYWCADNHHTANSACCMACLQLSYEIGTQVPFHKALAFVYKKVHKMFLTLWNNTIGR